MAYNKTFTHGDHIGFEMPSSGKESDSEGAQADTKDYSLAISKTAGCLGCNACAS